MTAFKKGEDRDTAILRLFNTTGEAVTLTVELSPIFKSAKLTNLNEEPYADAEITDGKITLDIGAKKIVTLELEA